MKKPDKTNTKNETITTINRPLQFLMPDSTILSRFSNFAFVQHQPENFTITFYEIQQPPLTAESEEDKKKALEGLDSIPAVCSARIVLTPKHFRELLKAMQSSLEKHDRNFPAPNIQVDTDKR